LHKGHQPVGCRAKAKTFRKQRSGFGNKRVESRCNNEAQWLELKLLEVERLDMQEQGFDKLSLTSVKQYGLITKLSGLEGINKFDKLLQT
jgi:hypothetical protein